MFRYKNTSQRLIDERLKREELERELEQKKADIEYLAMMCDVELDTGGGENDES